MIGVFIHELLYATHRALPHLTSIYYFRIPSMIRNHLEKKIKLRITMYGMRMTLRKRMMHIIKEHRIKKM